MVLRLLLQLISLFRLLGNVLGTSITTTGSSYADDAFSKLCYVTVSDASPKVRTTVLLFYSDILK